MGLTSADTHPEWTLRAMGQAPLNPPDVSGWKQNAYWISTSAMWARGDWAGWMRWVASEKGMFEEVLSMTPQAAVQFAFDRFAIVDPAPRTRTALEQFVVSERAANRSWAVKPNLIALLLLSPDFQLA